VLGTPSGNVNLINLTAHSDGGFTLREILERPRTARSQQRAHQAAAARLWRLLSGGGALATKNQKFVTPQLQLKGLDCVVIKGSFSGQRRRDKAHNASRNARRGKMTITLNSAEQYDEF
jgi:hypothetical protein